MKVMVLSGHGNHEGAKTLTMSERNCNQAVTTEVKKFLSAYNCEVVTNENQDYEYKKIINGHYDLCVEIHHNAGAGDGCEVYFKPYTAVTEQSKVFANILIQEFGAIGQNSRGVKNGQNFGSLICASSFSTPCVLAEFAFIDNERDNDIIDTPAELVIEASAYGKAIVRFLGVTLKEQPKPQPQPQAVNLYAKGRAIVLNKTPLYGTATSPTIAGYKTGTYFIYDGLEFRGRYRITNNARLAGVTGYINKEAIK